MAESKKAVRDAKRAEYIQKVSEFLAAQGDEVLVTGSNELAIPVVRADGEEDYIVLTFKMPTGSRDGDPYDGYAMAEDYQMKLAQKEEKAKAAAEAKAKKDCQGRKDAPGESGSESQEGGDVSPFPTF